MQIGCRVILELCRSKRNTAADRNVPEALEMCALLIRHRNAAEFYVYAVIWVRLPRAIQLQQLLQPKILQSDS